MLAASRADGLAYVTPGQHHGVFTRHLLAGLGGGASRGGGWVRICDLFEYVQERVVAEQPGQRPVFKAELEENYPISRARRPLAAGTIPPPPDELAYDVFLTYARRDPEIRAWVERVLVPFLEGCGIKLCLEHRDFAAGEQRVHDTEAAVAHCRYTLAVLSPISDEDDRAGLRSVVALHRSLYAQGARLVPLLRRPCRIELDACMTSLHDLTRDEDVLAGLQRLALALREPPRPRLDP